MRIERVTEPDSALVEAIARLMPQLTSRDDAPGLLELAELAAAPGTNLLVARDGETAIGMLTLVVYRAPGGLRGVIEDVVVDEAARGRGVGEALMREALALAEVAGVESVALTSRPDREAANRLYRRVGFEQRETNVYVWRPR
jgi:ribosomal protein S18 acetylase RimI-like enzyme